MPERITLHPLAAQHVRELRAKFGVEPTVDDVVWLHSLACDVSRPAGLPHPGIAGGPVRCGNIVLWPMTIGAGRWYLRVGAVLFPAGSNSIYALALAMEHARAPSKLAAMYDHQSTLGAINDFKDRAGARLAEVHAAIECIQAREAARVGNGDDKSAASVDAGCLQVIANLCKLYPGTTPDYWQWSIGRTECVDWIVAYHQQHEAGGKKVNTDDPCGLAFQRFIEAKAQIIAEHRVTDE